MRSFRSPSGRHWVAQVVFLPVADTSSDRITELAALEHAPAVLRFTSDSLVLELHEWPADWESLSDEALVALARRAQPPSLGLSPTDDGADAEAVPPRTPRPRRQ